MCGIAGIYAYHYAANTVDRAEVFRIRDHMANRGPDDRGTWFSQDGRVGLGHRRLSIIDLSEAGAQPMISADSKLIVSFNGEIYNYRELRKGLIEKGHLFRSQSDTEVLLHLYAEKGPEMLSSLRGMFAFSIWDVEKQQLFLARDPFGIKPLYYADDGWTLRFASQVKSLLESGAVSRDRDPAGWVGFYLLGSVPEPFTIYREIRAVPAGSYMVVDRLGPKAPNKYYSVASAYCNAEQRCGQTSSGRSSTEEIREALLDSVRQHLVADVPVGAFLSAGIDSSALVGLMRDAGQTHIKTVTLSFEEFRGENDDEAPLASEIAKTFHTEHTTRVVTEQEFRSDLPLIMNAMDQPTIDAINTWFVAKAARELGLKVAVSGLGGDELFGGYSSFRILPKWVRVFAMPSRVPLLGRCVRKAAAAMRLNRVGLHPKAAGMLEYGGTYAGAYLLRRGLFMPWELDQLLERDIVKEGLRRLALLASIGVELQPRPRSPFAKVAVLETALYLRNQLLRDTDWASMAHSLEVRVPLVDAELLGKIAPLTTMGSINGKMALAQSPQVRLPETVISRRKTGFGTPIGLWLQRTSPSIPYASIPSLATAGCHWSRRWAYGLACS